MMNYQNDFINKIKDGAMLTQKKYGVFASITIAQAILESGWGQSKLTQECNNLFGVKAIGGWKGARKLYPTYEYYNGVKTLINDYFRVYNNYTESIVDHAIFLVVNRRYRENGLFASKNYVEQANALVRSGYATNQNYAKDLINIINIYNLNQYDVVKPDSFITLDGGGYASYKGGSPALNVIIRDFKNVDRVFIWVDNDKGCSWAFDVNPLNSNYTKLVKNCNKVVSVRNGGYTFSKGSNYKLKAIGYKDFKRVCESQLVLKVPSV